jgi:uncharacterized OsmC-like protein
MNADELRTLQSPLKQKYKDNPDTALFTLHAEAKMADGIACKIDTGRAMVEAGLHPATGGDGSQVCSGDMLLEALVACAGLTLRTVATALGVELRDATVHAEADLDFRGTLGISKDVQVGFREIRLGFDLDTDAPPEQLEKVIELTERYCVVLQTLKNPLKITSILR